MNPWAQPDAPKWLVDWLGPDYFGHVNVVFLGKDSGDAEMAQVGRFRRLRGVYIANHTDSLNGTDSGVVHLAGLADLKTLVRAGTRVTGASLVHLAGSTGLEVLRLDRLPIRDADLVSLANLAALQTLDLDGTAITDAGLATLAKFPALGELHLSDTEATPAGMQALRQARPALRVE